MQLLLLAFAAEVSLALPPVSLKFVNSAPTCMGFRQTGGCSPTGPRQPDGDLGCNALVVCVAGNCPSGYCDCGDGILHHPVTCKPGSHPSFTCEAVCAGLGNRSGLVLSNAYAEVLLNVENASVVSIRGDVSGTGNFSTSPNVLGEGGLRLGVQGDSGYYSKPGAAAITVIANTTSFASIRLEGIVDDHSNPSVEETWEMSLGQASRSFVFNASGSVTKDISARAITRDVPLSSLSIYGLFTDGVVQMKQFAKGGYFFANSSLDRFYSMGGGSAIDVGISSTSAPCLVSNVAAGTPSGFTDVLASTVSAASSEVKRDAWQTGLWPSVPVDLISAGHSWTASMVIAPNNRNFPSLRLPAGNNLPASDLEALMTGVYGSSPGCLCTYPGEVVAGKAVAQIATTIARPDRGYQGTYNYFDPDNFISLSAMLYTGDAFLQQQARAVVERSGAFLKPSGQLPHHFVKDVPTFTALSGATQTGPNVFWTKTALQYVKATGDLTWLKTYMPTLRLAASFCFDLVDADYSMLDAPGSLMIDVFIRQHFTSDSNAMMVGFMREFADAEEAVGNSTGAATLRAQATRMEDAINSLLWAVPGKGLGGDDHYITQLNRDNTTRDFVDYDANLIALAHGIASTDRAKRLFARIDSGRCSAAKGAGPQFVSEVYYGKSDTTHGNVGDSWCSMGRIAWFDAHARAKYGDQTTFDDAILAPLQRDLIKYTWMHERYGCDGQQQQNRTADYFEYPSVVAMLLREVRYGINLGFLTVSISPFGPTDFAYHVGDINVEYSPDRLLLGPLPGTGENKTFTVTGMAPGASYAGTVAANDCDCPSSSVDATASGTGVLVFSAPVGPCCTVALAKR